MGAVDCQIFVNIVKQILSLHVKSVGVVGAVTRRFITDLVQEDSSFLFIEDNILSTAAT